MAIEQNGDVSPGALRFTMPSSFYTDIRIGKSCVISWMNADALWGIGLSDTDDNSEHSVVSNVTGTSYEWTPDATLKPGHYFMGAVSNLTNLGTDVQTDPFVIHDRQGDAVSDPAASSSSSSSSTSTATSSSSTSLLPTSSSSSRYPNNKSKAISGGAKAGIGIAAVFLILFLTLFALWFWRRSVKARRTRHRRIVDPASLRGVKAELGTSEVELRERGLPESRRLEELQGDREVGEMGGGGPWERGRVEMG